MNRNMLSAEAQTLRETYAALNRNDIPAAVQAFDPHIEWIEPAEYTGGGTHHGLARVEAHLAQARARWAEGSCEAERLLAAGDKIIVFVHVHVRLKDETEWREGRHADVYTFRAGKAVQMRIFEDIQEALGWCGAKVPDAG